MTERKPYKIPAERFGVNSYWIKFLRNLTIGIVAVIAIAWRLWG